MIMIIDSLNFKPKDSLLLILHFSFKVEHSFLLEYLLQVESFMLTIFPFSSFFIEDFWSI
jgi:hypothetical protein